MSTRSRLPSTPVHPYVRALRFFNRVWCNCGPNLRPPQNLGKVTLHDSHHDSQGPEPGLLRLEVGYCGLYDRHICAIARNKALLLPIVPLLCRDVRVFERNTLALADVQSSHCNDSGLFRCDWTWKVDNNFELSEQSCNCIDLTSNK
jgi:hypothetical protein